MAKITPSVVFFGSGPVAAASLAGISNHFTVEAVITKPVPPHHKENAPVETLAKSLGFRILFAGTKNELDEIVTAHLFKSTIGVVVDYGVIISEKVINKFEYGIINSHFSLLPQWRGADPITFSILSGQPKTGVSLMVIDDTLDTGKLITQKSIFIDVNETTPTLTERLVELSNRLLREYIPLYLNSKIAPKKQPHPDRATYSRKLTKADGVIDWSKPAIELEREVRAYADWPQSRASFKNIDVIITMSHFVETTHAIPGSIEITSNDELLVHTSNGSLSIDSLKPVGKKEMPIKAFLAGYRSRLLTD